MLFSEFEFRRLRHYFAGIKNASSGPSDVASTIDANGTPEPVWQKNTGPLLCGASETRWSIEGRIRENELKFAPRNHYAYIRPAQSFFSRVDPNANFLIQPADNTRRFEFPVVVKSRRIADNDAQAVILPLNRQRHFAPIAEVLRLDRPFREKDNRLIWRGVTTGLFFKATPDDSYSSRYYVSLLDNLKEDIDVKLSAIVQITEDTCDRPIDEIRSRLAEPLQLQDQLKSKFLLSLEGNDVASGLKWMLASNSTVIMPPVTCETWFCESELEPWIHFVPVKHDLSNINEVHDWCLSNLEECEAIARNGKEYVMRFLSFEREIAIIDIVVSSYVSACNFELNFNLLEKLIQIPYRSKVRKELRLFEMDLAKWKTSLL